MSNSNHRSLTPQTQHMSARLSRSTHSTYGLPSGFAPSASFPGESIGSTSSGSTVKPANPFVTNPHGHPSFNPIKLGSKSGSDSKTPKQPKPPDKPLMPYMRYSRKVSRLVWDSVKANNPDLKLWEIGKIIGQMWRELSDEEKQQYIDEYETEKVQYMEAMKVYHNSQAYQSWIAAKGKVDVDAEQEEPEKARRSKVPPPQPVEQRVIPIQPTEEEDELDDSLSVKHIAAVRYQRNHCLINEIFSDAVVPDVRTIINETRMTVLKRQVHSLTMHQKKLEGELQQIEDKHQTKKCKFSESSEQFYAELRNLCDNKPQISDEQFNLMILKAKEDQKDKQRTLLQKETESQNHLNEKSKVEIRMVTEENLSEKSELTAVSATAPPPNTDQPNENNTSLKIMEMNMEETMDERMIPTSAELSALELESEPQNSEEQQQQVLQESSSNTELVLPSISSEAVHEESMESEIAVLKDSAAFVETGNGNDVEVLDEKFSVVETSSEMVEESVSAAVGESSHLGKAVTEKITSETSDDVEGKSTDERMEITPEGLDAEMPEIPEFKADCRNEIDGAREQEIDEVTEAKQNDGQIEDKSLEPERPDEPLLQCESETLPESSAVVASQTPVMASESDSSEISMTELPLSESGAPTASATDTGENKTSLSEQVDSDREMPVLDAIESL